MSKEFIEKEKCPICQGTGKLSKPYTSRLDWAIQRKMMAKTLLKNGYSVRQIQKMCGYGSTRSVQIIRNSLKAKPN